MDSHAFNVLSLFSGCYGLDFGVELAVTNSRVVCGVEREAYACALLVQRMQEGCLAPFPIWSDIRTFDGKPWRGVVDCVVGGFPCQDISNAGKMAGIRGERSGLWYEMARIVGEVRPSYVFVENVDALLVRGIDSVCGSLAALGYDACWETFSAAQIGAPHIRKRVFILAHLQGAQWWQSSNTGAAQESSRLVPGNGSSMVGDTEFKRLQIGRGQSRNPGEELTPPLANNV